MRSKLLSLIDALRSSYWFLPSIMSVGAVILAFSAAWIDSWLGVTWLDKVGWLSANEPAGARQLLATVAGSMITVAGVAFTMTIAAVVHASSQYGPRLLTSFMRDRGNQLTLGSFIATFLYCLLVLKAVRDAPGDGEGFVPHVAIATALGLAVLSLGFLIYFIHHVPASMHVAHVVSTVGFRLIDRLEGVKGAADEARRTATPDRLPDDFETASPVALQADGYLQSVDLIDLMASAEARDLVIRLRCRPGDFVNAGETVIEAWPAHRVDDDTRHELADAFVLGDRRTDLQDHLFLVAELVEIAARALSPGVNDPFTAISCIDWLRAGTARIARHEARSAFRYDDSQALRLVVPSLAAADVVAAGYDRIRPYAAQDPIAARHLMTALGISLRAAETGELRQALVECAASLRAEAAKHLEERDAKAIAEGFDIVLRLAGDFRDQAPQPKSVS